MIRNEDRAYLDGEWRDFILADVNIQKLVEGAHLPAIMEIPS